MSQKKMGPYPLTAVNSWVEGVERRHPAWEDKKNNTLQTKLSSSFAVTISFYPKGGGGEGDVFIQGKDAHKAWGSLLRSMPTTAAPLAKGAPQTKAAPAAAAGGAVSGEEVISFGKHMGKTFLDVFVSDADYVRWAQRTANPSGPLERFTAFCAQQGAAGKVAGGHCNPQQSSLKRPHGSSVSAVGSKAPKLEGSAGPRRPRTYNYYVFFDGSCPNNVVTGMNNPAGFGVVAFENSQGLADSPEVRQQVIKQENVKIELYGPVVPSSKRRNLQHGTFFIGAETGSNNTGELTGAAESLLWLIDQQYLTGRSVSALVLYDSKYAANAITGVNMIEKNPMLAGFGKWLLHQARARSVVVLFEHVKGHAGNFGNERADRLADLGAKGDFSNAGRFTMCSPYAEPDDDPSAVSRKIASPSLSTFNDAEFNKFRCETMYCDCLVDVGLGPDAGAGAAAAPPHVAGAVAQSLRAERGRAKGGVHRDKEFCQCANVRERCGFRSWV